MKFISGNSDYDSHSVRIDRDLFRWDIKGSDGTINIPYEMSEAFTYRFYADIMNAITDINLNLEGCIQFRFVYPLFTNNRIYLGTIHRYLLTT